jgi:hypothetical protein
MTGRLPQPYHVYLDLDFINNDVESGAKPHPLVFEETRNSPFLEGDCSNYFCSIVRFSIQTGASLPVFIPRIDTSQSDPNKTVYKITLSYGTQFITNSVEYAPAPKNTQTPLANNYSNNYYFIYNYQDWIDMVNGCFGATFDELAAMLPPTTLNSTCAPFLEIDPSTNTCILNAETSSYQTDLADSVKIYFNSRLFALFTGFQNNFIEYTGDLNYMMLVVNRNGTNTTKTTTTILQASPPISTTYTYVQMYQEVSSVSLWNPVASIVFCSSMLPIYPAQTSTPTVMSNQSNNLSSTGDNANLTNILSDFEIAIEGANQYRPMILYAPTSEYRLIDMFSGSNLNRINIQVFWKDQFGNLNPFFLDPGCAAHLKLMFRRKDFYVA